MKTTVRITGRPYKGNPVGSEVVLDGPKAKLLASLGRGEIVNVAKPAVAKKAPAKKAPAKKAVKKAAAKKVTKTTATKAITGTRDRSMRGKTATK